MAHSTRARRRAMIVAPDLARQRRRAPRSRRLVRVPLGRARANKRLIRVFENVVGLPPKTTARVLRFHAALRALSAEANANRTELAQRLGYFDQAHFDHEFRRLAGVAPGDFVARQGEDGESLIVR